jgi:hypothetical protein
MKELLLGVALVALVGIAGFLYRNIVEHSSVRPAAGLTACTQEAKLCPDGSTVGRTGPNCTFAPCPISATATPLTATTTATSSPR